MDNFVTCERAIKRRNKKIGEIYLRRMLKDKNKLELELEKRFKRRQVILEKQEAGQTLDPAPTL